MIIIVPTAVFLTNIDRRGRQAIHCQQKQVPVERKSVVLQPLGPLPQLREEEAHGVTHVVHVKARQNTLQNTERECCNGMH